MKSAIIAFVLVFLSVSGMNAQSYDFESGTPAPFETVNSANTSLSVVTAPYKDGVRSLSWEWTAPSELVVDVTVAHKNFRDGVIFWVYNETPSTEPLRCEYRDMYKSVQYYFDFGLNFRGWRICRIGSKYMLGDKKVSDGLKLHMISPKGVQKGRLFIDRFSFVKDVDYQNAPDAQQPNNTEEAYINHWNSLWKWESTLKYDLPLRTTLSAVEKSSLVALQNAACGFMAQSAQVTVVTQAKSLFTNAGIKREGNFITGFPFVLKTDKKPNELALAEMGTMLYGFAQDYLFNKVKSSRDNFLLTWDYAVDQGFAWGSAMGNNHHYGYEARDIFKAVFLMRDVLKETGRLNDAIGALCFWSGLPETRAEYNQVSDGVVDSWNTLLQARLLSALMIENECERFRAVESLTRWVSGSLFPTPGNVGGIKSDGTVFHHAGAYPAYAVGGLGSLGDFFGCINKSCFAIPVESRKNMANALLAMSRYTHFKDWSIGFSGRHPFDGDVPQDVVDAFGYLALSGGIYNPSEKYDSSLAAEYMRLQTVNSTLKNEIAALGINPAVTPQGFYVFNHAALGIHRQGNSMVSIKGYNSDVWGSEIYTKDNRFGRYQSYGAVEILNEGSPVSRLASRFDENGWDWNRLPGTTTIHLPFNLLESPQTQTLMARSAEDFAGASSLNAQFGVFGMKLQESNDINNTNFTPDFEARKSVFAFGKRLICLGSDINNSNAEYPTETTIFQNSLQNTSEKISVDGAQVKAFDQNQNIFKMDKVTVISDVIGNYYRFPFATNLCIKGGSQSSFTNTTKAPTNGNFVTAWIDHGHNPIDGAYEYMIMLKPSEAEVVQWTANAGYEVIECDNTAHIVKDIESNTTAYVCFFETTPVSGKLLKCTEETLVMMQEPDATSLSVSVCDPSLHLPEKTKNSDATTTQSEAVEKRLLIKGYWVAVGVNPAVKISYLNDVTIVDVTCQNGMPVEFGLKQSNVKLATVTQSGLKVGVRENTMLLTGRTNAVQVYGAAGQLVYSNHLPEYQRCINLKKFNAYVLCATLPDSKVFTQLVRI